MLCICDDIVSVPNRTEVVILQHPRERDHPIGTARIALLGLERARLFTWGHKQAGAAERLEALRRSLPVSTVLLYPDADAPAATALSRSPDALLVVDGTWSTAKRMMRHAPWILDLPRVRVEPSRPGQYRLRREPSAEHLSTVEAVVEALAAIEPETPGLDQLIAAFQRMIDRQVPFVDARERPRFRTRPRRRPRVPAELLDDHNLVVVGGEYAGTERTYRWVGHRLGNGEVFDRWLAPRPAPDHLAHIGVGGGEVAEVVSPDEAARAWSAFARPEDVRVGWSERVMRRSPGHGGIAVKRVYCGLIRGRAGHLSDVVRERGLPVPAPVVPGRTGRRLAELVAVLGWLRAQA